MFALGNIKLYFPINTVFVTFAKTGPVFSVKQNQLFGLFLGGCHVGKVHRQKEKKEKDGEE